MRISPYAQPFKAVRENYPGTTANSPAFSSDALNAPISFNPCPYRFQNPSTGFTF